jgi:hypothetical protein
MNKTLQELASQSKSNIALVTGCLGLVVLFIGISLVWNSRSQNTETTSDDTSTQPLSSLDGSTYSITSENGEVDGLVGIQVQGDEGDSYRLLATFNMNVTSELPQNLICNRELYIEESDCPSYNFYNYIGSLDIFDGDLQTTVQSRMDVVACEDGFQEVQNPQSTNYGPYIRCYSGLSGSLISDEFYVGITSSFNTEEDLLNITRFGVYDSSEFTTRNNETAEGVDAVAAKEADNLVTEYTVSISKN